MDLKTGASIEPVAVAYSAVKKVLQFIPGKDVLIYGPGAIGLYTAQIARIAGAGKILMAGTAADQDRLELARKNYNVEIVNVDEEDVDEDVYKRQDVRRNLCSERGRSTDGPHLRHYWQRCV